MPLHMLIFDPDSGEEMLVLDTVGHEHCKVLEEGVVAPKVPGCRREGGKWKIADKEATRLRLLESQSPKVLARRLFDIEARLDKAGL